MNRTRDQQLLPPIVFVHGDGDTAALWHTTLWRFEANGWPRQRLHAIDMPYPRARDSDDTPQPGRSSTTEHMRYLSGEVDQVLKATGAQRLVLFGSSRGGLAIRNFIARGDGAPKVSHAILAGTPNHGVQANPDHKPGSEFNGASPFLRSLNAPQGPNGNEVTPGLQWLTIRSDHNDKYAQPDGSWLGLPGTATHVNADGPALRGACNVVLAGADHRETAFSVGAFEQVYRFITGEPPATLDPPHETHPVLNGKVSGRGVDNLVGDEPSNLALVGACIEVYATDATTGRRRGEAVHHCVVGSDGLWGPFNADSTSSYEFVISAPGYAVTHVYRSPFARSSDIVHFRAERAPATDPAAKSVVTLTRPRGYFGVPRDHISLGGESPPHDIPSGVAGVSVAAFNVTDATGRTVVGEFNGERIAGIAWPAAEHHVVLLELHT